MSASISSNSFSIRAFATSRPLSKNVWCTKRWYLLGFLLRRPRWHDGADRRWRKSARRWCRWVMSKGRREAPTTCRRRIGTVPQSFDRWPLALFLRKTETLVFQASVIASGGSESVSKARKKKGNKTIETGDNFGRCVGLAFRGSSTIVIVAVYPKRGSGRCKTVETVTRDDFGSSGAIKTGRRRT